jgi:hypothetical protein
LTHNVLLVEAYREGSDLSSRDSFESQNTKCPKIDLPLEL